MPDEQTEQIPEVTTEQSAPLAEQAEPVAEDGDGAVAEDAGAVAESEVEAPPPIDWSKPENVRGVLDSPEYKGIRDLLEEQRLSGENTARQKLDAEMRQRAVSDEVIADRLKSIALEAGWDADDERLRRAVTAFHEPAVRRSKAELATNLIMSGSGALTDEGRSAIEIAVNMAEGDPDKLMRVFGQLWTGFGQRVADETVANISLDDLPEGSKLRKDIEARVAKEVEAELKARETAANKQEVPPRTSNGTPGSITRDPSNLTEYETKLATTGELTASEWQAYLRARETAGMR